MDTSLLSRGNVAVRAWEGELGALNKGEGFLKPSFLKLLKPQVIQRSYVNSTGVGLIPFSNSSLLMGPNVVKLKFVLARSAGVI